jgi:hypothetical protein
VSTFDIESIEWERSRIIRTKHGPRRILEWTSPSHSDSFWQLWHTGHEVIDREKIGKSEIIGSTRQLLSVSRK